MPSHMTARPGEKSLSASSRLRFSFMSILLLLFLSVGTAGADRLYIDVSSPDVKPLPIAIPNLKVVGELPRNQLYPNVSVADELRRDLLVVGEFEIVDPRTYIEDPQAAPLKPDDQAYAEWRALGTELLIKGQVSAGENGGYVVELYAYDVTRRSFLFGKRYRSPPKAVSEVAHIFANALMEEITGKPGAFGSELAFAVKRGKTKNIGVVKMNGTSYRQLTDNDTLNLNPVWSRDGTSIYITSYFGGKPDLCRIQVSSRELKYVYRKGSLSMPGEESPDGRTLLFSASHDGNADIYAMDLITRATRKLTNSRGLEVSPVWSPDGRKFVYVSDMRGNPHLFLADIDDPEAPHKRLTFEGRHNGDPAWAPDGKKIAYTGMDEKGIFQVYSIDLEGGDPVQLTKGGYDTYQPSWSPDGRFLAVTSRKEGPEAVFIFRPSVNRMWRVSPPGMEASQPSWSYGHVAH